MRDFLYSEIANFYGEPNIPDDPDLAIRVGTQLCETLLEPLQDKFGRLSIRSSFRSSAINERGNREGHNCASNSANYAGHIWDHLDEDGCAGATACIIVNSFIPFYEATGRWEAMAWWVHDHLPYSQIDFFPRYAAFNLSWHEKPVRMIHSWVPPRRGTLTKPGMTNHSGSHEAEYSDMLQEMQAG